MVVEVAVIVVVAGPAVVVVGTAVVMVVAVVGGAGVVGAGAVVVTGEGPLTASTAQPSTSRSASNAMVSWGILEVMATSGSPRFELATTSNPARPMP